MTSSRATLLQFPPSSSRPVRGMKERGWSLGTQRAQRTTTRNHLVTRVDVEHFEEGSLLPSVQASTPTHRCFRNGGSSDVLTDSDTSYELADTKPWTKVGKLDPRPITLNLSGTEQILRRLQKVEMVQSARRAVTGDGICIGPKWKPGIYPPPKRTEPRID